MQAKLTNTAAGKLMIVSLHCYIYYTKNPNLIRNIVGRTQAKPHAKDLINQEKNLNT